jgi:tRNA(Ile)-lysidine synthase
VSAGLDPAALLKPLASYDKVGLAVSGGPDSLALMLLAAQWAANDSAAPSFIIYSVDHRLRPEAAAEVAMVLREATRLGLPARALRWDGTKPATGIQQAARSARYRLIRQAMAHDGAEVLVTAHHMVDQAETVLMRLAHGSGIEGLRGMDNVADIDGLRIVRPLLGVDPADLRALVSEAGLTAASDPSNFDEDYERVRWRRMLPQLAALGIDSRRLSQFAERMADADLALDALATAAFATAMLSDDPPSVTLSRAELAALPRAVAVRVISRALDRIGASQKLPALAAVEALTDRLVRGPVHSTLRGCLVRTRGDAIAISPEPLTGGRARRHEATKA